MSTPLHDKILEQIEHKHVRPKPKWQFRLKELFLWLGIVISLLLVSMSVSSLFFQSVNAFLLPVGAHVWLGTIRILSIILFLVVTSYQIIKTKNGYRRKQTLSIIFALIAAVCVAFLLLRFQVTAVVDQNIGNSGVSQRVERYWSQPANTGVLAGELIEITDTGYTIFRALDGSVHVLDIRFVEGDVSDLVDFLRVQMVGYEQGGIFYPCNIDKWHIKNAAPEYHPEYGLLENANTQFTDSMYSNNTFKKFFERKSDILRSNKCQ